MNKRFINEFCRAVAQRRREMGITQSRLAKLSGLSRASIAAIDRSKIKELGLTRAEKVLDALALRLQLSGETDRTVGATSASERAVVIANRGRRTNLDTDKLKRALIADIQLLDWGGHLKTLLEAAGIVLLTELAEELNKEHGVERAIVWKKIRTLATNVGATGPYWD